MRNKPRIRFKGFAEDWEQCKLGNLGTLKNGMNFSKEAMGKGYPFINLQNIFGSNVIDLTKLEKAEATDSQLKDYNLQKGDVLFVRSSVKLEGVGEAALISEDLKDTTFSGFIIRFRDNYGLDYNFKRFIFITVLIRNQIMSQATNSANKNISQSVLNNLYLFIPTKDEQSKIGLIFSKLDKCITLHQRKLEKLKLAKKALLQKLFPKNGSQFPEIRFKGFTDAWEQCKFSDITYLSGIKNKENKPYESYSISNEFGFIPQDEQFENGGTMKTADKSMYYIVSQNSFAYNPARINVGSIGYYDKPDNVIVSSLYEVFKTTDIVSDKFLWHWFKSNQFNRLIEKYQEGGVRLYFYYDKLCKGTIELPTINEQNKISNLLDDLDMYITLHQRKLDKLQDVKKGLLQKMFV